MNTDVLESNIRIANRTFIMEYNDPNSPQYKLLETEFCQAVSEAEKCLHLSSLFSTSLLSLPVTILTYDFSFMFSR